jgi:hypothetical protein
VVRDRRRQREEPDPDPEPELGTAAAMSCPRAVKTIQATEGGELRRRGRTGRLMQDGRKRAAWFPDPTAPGGVRVQLYTPVWCLSGCRAKRALAGGPELFRLIRDRSK